MRDPASLVAKLNLLRALDPDLQLFGAGKHEYALGAPLSEDEVAGFEAEHRVRLPPEYRAFLREAGNGGAGPVYGLAPLAAWTPDGFTQVTSSITTTDGAVFEAGTGPRPGIARPADPSRPFPLTEAWGPPAEDGSNLTFPADANPFDGCAFLAEIGCGYSYFLVLGGPRAGEVWEDYTAGDGKIGPTGRGFFAWYEDWLDQGLAERAAGLMLDEMRQHADLRPDLAAHRAVIEAQAASNPRWALGHLRVAIALAYEARYAEAEEAFGRVLAMEPRLSLEVAQARCVSLWRQGRMDDLARVAGEALAAGGYHYMLHRELHEVRLIALAASGRLPEAVEAARARVAFEQDDLGAWMDQAVLEARTGDRAAAEGTIRRAVAHAGERELDLTLEGGFEALAGRLDPRPEMALDAAHFRALARPS